MACYEKDCHYVMTHDGDCFYEGLPMDKKENCPMYKAKTNADRIRSMSDEELAEMLCSGTCKYCHSYNKDCDILEWLRKDADLKTIRKTEENADTFQQN